MNGVLCVIPARGGSKRLPRKNILPFFGKPLIAYTIEKALEAGCFERVIVSTEDEEIAGIAGRYGGHVVRRSADLATDRATVASVCLDLLEKEEGEGRRYRSLCCLYATGVFRTVEDIRKTVALLGEEGCESAMSVTSYQQYPHQAQKMSSQNDLEFMWPELSDMRSTDLPRLVVGNGSIYAVDVKAFRRLRTFNFPRSKGHWMPFERSIDMDTPEDFLMAEFWAKHNGFLGNKSGE